MVAEEEANFRDTKDNDDKGNEGGDYRGWYEGGMLGRDIAA